MPVEQSVISKHPNSHSSMINDPNNGKLNLKYILMAYRYGYDMVNMDKCYSFGQHLVTFSLSYFPSRVSVH
jgi:hypothetical protein